MRILRNADVALALPMAEAIEQAAEAFGALARGDAVVPLRSNIATPHGASLFMPAFVGGPHAALGLKVVNVREGNAAAGLPTVPGTIMVFDPATGLPAALIEATYLTLLRTAAASGLATDLLARRDARVLVIFGAGNLARQHVAAVCSVRPGITEILIVNRTHANAEALAAELSALPVHAARTVRAASAADATPLADIICTVTNTSTPVLLGALVKPGTHVNAAGSYTLEMQELDSDFVTMARVVVDAREAALAEAGDLLIPIAEGRFTADHVLASLGELVLRGDAANIRRSDEDVTLFKSVGIAVQDVSAASKVLQKADQLNLGTQLSI